MNHDQFGKLLNDWVLDAQKPEKRTELVAEYNKFMLETVIAKAGGIRELAEMLHINPAAVSTWDRVPIERLMQVERLIGIRRDHLRLDFQDWVKKDKA
jgi:hypothetical protein